MLMVLPRLLDETRKATMMGLMSAFLKWAGGLVAKEIVLRLIATSPMAYGVGLIVEAWKGADLIFDALPPLFWPILATLVFAVTAYSGFIAPIVEKYRDARKRKRLLLKNTYWAVKHAITPTILDESNSDRTNVDKLFAIAQHSAYNFVSDCRTKGWWKHTTFPPPIQNQDTLLAWDAYLSNLRSEFSE